MQYSVNTTVIHSVTFSHTFLTSLCCCHLESFCLQSSSFLISSAGNAQLLPSPPLQIPTEMKLSQRILSSRLDSNITCLTLYIVDHFTLPQDTFHEFSNLYLVKYILRKHPCLDLKTHGKENPPIPLVAYSQD